jgi:biotin transport system substrate-specific component
VHTATPTATLADLLPATRLRTPLLVLGAALLTAVCAQVTVHIPGTPVPVTLQTFAVLVSGAGLGWKAGGASQLLYLSLGVVGLPVFADGASGGSIVTGATGGYLVGFVVAAALVGWLAERGNDRRIPTSLLSMLAGSAVIYLFGVTWLAHSTGMSASQAIDAGMTPFLTADAVKLVCAGLSLPAAWKLSGRD